MTMKQPQILMTQDEARALRGQLIGALHDMGLIPANQSSVPSQYGSIEWSVDYGPCPGYRHHSIPGDKRNYGVILTVSPNRYSYGRKNKRLHRDLPSMLNRIVPMVNAKQPELVKEDNSKMEQAQRDFDRGWCAHRHDIKVKLINGKFHALITVGDKEVWQDDVAYAVSHDTLVFHSKIGKVDRWVTIGTLQKLLDHGILLNPADVKLVGSGDDD